MQGWWSLARGPRARGRSRHHHGIRALKYLLVQTEGFCIRQDRPLESLERPKLQLLAVELLISWRCGSSP